MFEVSTEAVWIHVGYTLIVPLLLFSHLFQSWFPNSNTTSCWFTHWETLETDTRKQWLKTVTSAWKKSLREGWSLFNTSVLEVLSFLDQSKVDFFHFVLFWFNDQFIHVRGYNIHNLIILSLAYHSKTLSARSKIVRRKSNCYGESIYCFYKVIADKCNSFLIRI